MIPKDQTRLHRGDKPEERGNCFPAVIASILEIDVEDVIQIQEHYNEDDWHVKLTYWLGKMGYDYCSADHFKCFHPDLQHQLRWDTGEDVDEYMERLRNEYKDQYYLVSGRSPRNKSINHIVIFKNGIMIHDPHPDKTGIETIENFTMLEHK